jgi:hypothetical protein
MPAFGLSNMNSQDDSQNGLAPFSVEIQSGPMSLSIITA